MKNKEMQIESERKFYAKNLNFILQIFYHRV